MGKRLIVLGLTLLLVADLTAGQDSERRRRSTAPSTFYEHRRRTVPNGITPAPTPSPQPSPTPQGSLQEQLQQKVAAVVAHYKTTYPDLAISLSYTDASQHVNAASGTAFGREITPTDTFLYGSGTKPFTAAAVLRLIDSGKVKATDKVSAILDPYLSAHGKPSLESWFGEAIANATVLELIRMGAGIRDFEDNFAFDQWALAPENSSKFWDYPYDAIKFAVSPENAGNGSGLYCSPGNCTAYSSTSFEVAGLVLAAVLQPTSAWYDFDLGSALFDDRAAYPSMSFPPNGNGTTNVSKYLTVPGTSVASSWQNLQMYDQDTSILGWTCGNMVASPSDVSKFFYHLLDDAAEHNGPAMLLSDSSRKQMTDYTTLSYGWMKGVLGYGAGLMDLGYKWKTGKRYNTTSKWVHVQGHEGDTYGFLSSQGYVPELHGAYSVVINVDNYDPLSMITCHLLNITRQVVNGADSDLGCTQLATQSTISTIIV